MARRLLSAAVGLPLVLGAAWLGGPWLAALAALAAAAASWELHGLLLPRKGLPRAAPALLFAAALAASGHWGGQAVAGVAAAGLLGVAAWHLGRSPAGGLGEWGAAASGPLYTGLPLAFGLLLRSAEGGREWLLLVLLTTFACDTGAYAVGRLLGRHRMAPRLSPGKTWEGAAGGLGAAAAAAAGASALLGLGLWPWVAAASGVALGVAAQVGDLVESRLKRAVGAKEAGRLVPGHGGLLDRLDSIAFTLVVGYYLAGWVSWQSG